ncbi:MAG: aromatic amino acid lyase, partial [Solirubrobacteraceae bacterium]
MNGPIGVLEGARQNIPIYWFNRAPGSGRESVIFEGDPLSAENRPRLLARQLATFKDGVTWGIGPEVADEEIVRAMMAVRANTMVYEAASPPLTQMLLDLLNKNISPVVQSRGSPGEGDLPMMANVGATMVGTGQAYHNGQRMPAAQALALAGLAPLAPFAADDAALTNAYSAGQAALLVHDSKRLLDWSDLTFSMSMLGLNSSVTPLAAVPQRVPPGRPGGALGDVLDERPCGAETDAELRCGADGRVAVAAGGDPVAGRQPARAAGGRARLRVHGRPAGQCVHGRRAGPGRRGARRDQACEARNQDSARDPAQAGTPGLSAARPAGGSGAIWGRRRRAVALGAPRLGL